VIWAAAGFVGTGLALAVAAEMSPNDCAHDVPTSFTIESTLDHRLQCPGGVLNAVNNVVEGKEGFCLVLLACRHLAPDVNWNHVSGHCRSQRTD